MRCLGDGLGEVGTGGGGGGYWVAPEVMVSDMTLYRTDDGIFLGANKLLAGWDAYTR